MKKEHISLIEGSPLGAIQKARLLLIKNGDKPGAYIRMYQNNGPLSAVTDILKKTGLFFVLVDPPMKGCLYTIAVGNTQDVAGALQLAAPGGSNADYTQQGLLSGYPKTAVVAYTMGGSLRTKEHPDDMKDNPLGFRFSRVGREAEFDYVRSLMNTLKQLSPAIFSELYPVPVPHALTV